VRKLEAALEEVPYRNSAWLYGGNSPHVERYKSTILDLLDIFRCMRMEYMNSSFLDVSLILLQEELTAKGVSAVVCLCEEATIAVGGNLWSMAEVEVISHARSWAALLSGVKKVALMVNLNNNHWVSFVINFAEPSVRSFNTLVTRERSAYRKAINNVELFAYALHVLNRRRVPPPPLANRVAAAAVTTACRKAATRCHHASLAAVARP